MIVGDASVAMIKAGSMTRDSYWDGNPGVGGFFVVLQDCWIVTLLRGRRARGKYRGSWEGRRGCLRTINRCWSRSWCRGRWNTGAFWWSTRCSVYTSRSIRRRICRGSSIYLRSADSDPSHQFQIVRHTFFHISTFKLFKFRCQHRHELRAPFAFYNWNGGRNWLERFHLQIGAVLCATIKWKLMEFYQLTEWLVNGL